MYRITGLRRRIAKEKCKQIKKSGKYQHLKKWIMAILIKSWFR